MCEARSRIRAMCESCRPTHVQCASVWSLMHAQCASIRLFPCVLCIVFRAYHHHRSIPSWLRMRYVSEPRFYLLVIARVPGVSGGAIAYAPALAGSSACAGLLRRRPPLSVGRLSGRDLCRLRSPQREFHTQKKLCEHIAPLCICMYARWLPDIHT